MNYLPLIGIVLLFWLFLIRPQSRRQKELRSMQSSLSVGDEVMLTSGVFATVSAVADDHLLVEIADGVVIKVVPAAIGSTVVRPAEADDAREENDQEPGDPTADGAEES